MIKLNVRAHSILRRILAAMTLVFATGAVVQPAAAVVIPQTTQQQPSLATFNGKLYIAWPGSNNLQLNVASSADGTTFGAPAVIPNRFAASDTGPAIIEFLNQLYIVWAGVGNDLRIASSSDGVNFGNPSNVSNFTSSCSPALAATSTTLFVAYCINLNTILVTSSTDGVNWTFPSSPSGFVSPWSPALTIVGNQLVLSFTTPQVGSVPGSTLLWTAPASGTTSLVWTQWTGPVSGFSGSCCGGPGLATINSSLAGVQFIPPNGTAYEFNYELSNGQLDFESSEMLSGAVISQAGPALASFNGHLYLAWKGTDNPAHLNIVEVF